MSSAQPFGRRGLQTAVGPSLPYSPSPPPRLAAPPPAREAKSFDIGWLLFSFEGRLRRRDYWLSKIGLLIVLRVLILVTQNINNDLKQAQAAHTTSGALLMTVGFGLLLILAALGTALWAGFAVVVKRWHDRDKPWAWGLLGFVPIVGWLWQGIECAFLEGTLGPNRFGPSPKGIVGITYADSLAETFS